MTLVTSPTSMKIPNGCHAKQSSSGHACFHGSKRSRHVPPALGRIACAHTELSKLTRQSGVKGMNMWMLDWQYIHTYIHIYTCRYVYNTYLLMFQREAKWLDWYSIVLYRIQWWYSYWPIAVHGFECQGDQEPIRRRWKDLLGACSRRAQLRLRFLGWPSRKKGTW